MTKRRLTPIEKEFMREFAVALMQQEDQTQPDYEIGVFVIALLDEIEDLRKNQRPAIELSVMDGGKGKHKPPPETPADGRVSPLDVITDLMDRQRFIKNISVVVEEVDDVGAYCAYNTMDQSKRSFLLHVMEHEFFSCFAQQPR